MKNRVLVGLVAWLVAAPLVACGSGATPSVSPSVAPSSATPTVTSPAPSSAPPKATPSASPKPKPSSAAPVGKVQKFPWKDTTPGHDTPQGIAKKFFVEMYNKDTAAACSCFVPGLAATVCEPMLKSRLGSLPDGMNQVMDTMNPTILVTISGSTASVDVVMEGQSSDSAVHLTKQDGKWYIAAES